MLHLSFLIVTVVIVGLTFDFINGFHDASNSIATIVATGVLKPWQAVLWAAFFNVIAVFFFGTGVAKTVGSGLIVLDAVTPMVVLCALTGAALWGLITWRLALPSSSSHALLGGYAGSAIIHNIFYHGWRTFWSPMIIGGWINVLVFIILAPLIGFILAFIISRCLAMLHRQAKLKPTNSAYKKVQLLSSAFLSLMHGSNDAQKTAGIITGALVAGHILPSFNVPIWVLVLSYGTIGLGTLFGGWRIVRTMGYRLTHLTSQSGVCAESAAALSIFFATWLNLPVSTTHVVTGAIIGVGTANDPRRVRWSLGGHIVWAWVLTIPASAIIAGCVIAVIDFIYG